jgi:hypothetical protein
MVATLVAALAHVPPVIASVSIAVLPAHTLAGPVIGDTVLTVIVLVAVEVLPQASVTVTV